MFDALVTLLPLNDEPPLPEDVKAGPIALLIFVLGILAVVLLSFSFRKRMRKVAAAYRAGAYGESSSAASPAAYPVDGPRRDGGDDDTDTDTDTQVGSDAADSSGDSLSDAGSDSGGGHSGGGDSGGGGGD